MKIVVCGASGVLGRGIVKLLTARGFEVKGIDFQMGEPNYIDILDRESVFSFIRMNDFDYLINCVGSYSNHFNTDLNLNVNGTYNLLEGILEFNPSSKIILIGTSAEYGEPETEVVSENHSLNPINVYGLTKKMQTDVFQYFCQKGLNLVLLRVFNLLDSQLPESLFIGHVYKQIRDLKNGVIDKIKVGFIDNYRDYIKTESLIDDLESILKNFKSGEIYNIGSGDAIQIKQLLINILRSEGIHFDVIEDVVEYNTSSDFEEVNIIVSDRTKIDRLRITHE